MRKIIILEERSQPHLSQIQNQQEKKKGKKKRIVKSYDIKSMIKNAANKRKAPKENDSFDIFVS